MSTDLDRPLDLMELIRGGEIPETENADEIALRIVQQVLNATTLEQVFEVGGSTACNELKGVPFELQDVKVMKSELGGRFPVYLLLQAKLRDSGEELVLNTSAARLMAQAWRAKELDLLPLMVQVVEVAKPKPGQDAPIGLATV